LTAAVCLSLLCNVALVVWLIRQSPAKASSPSDSNRIPGATTQTHLSVSTSNAALATAIETRTRPTFLWNQIESTDYRQYVANLRAVGCPEQIIRDIILADVNHIFQARAQAIWSPTSTKYWQKSSYKPPRPDQEKQIMALSSEQTALVKELVGVALSAQSLVDTVFLQLHGSEQQLLFLPPDKREAVLNALADSNPDWKEAELYNGDHTQEAQRKLFDEKLKLLAKVLSPEELDEFQLRYAPGTQQLRTELKYFDCTPEEFSALLDSRQKNDKAESLGNPLDRKAATEEVRRLFGEARAEEFERVTDMYYINAREVVEAQGAARGTRRSSMANHPRRETGCGLGGCGWQPER
jgi:hypothetical protein